MPKNTAHNPYFDPKPHPRRDHKMCRTCPEPAAKGHDQCNKCMIKARKTPKPKQEP